MILAQTETNGDLRSILICTNGDLSYTSIPFLNWAFFDARKAFPDANCPRPLMV